MVQYRNATNTGLAHWSANGGGRAFDEIVSRHCRFPSGLTGQLYQQFSLLIAATAVISAINAVTLKSPPAALWMRALDPDRRRNAVFLRHEI